MNKQKIIIGVVVIILIALGGYMYLSGGMGKTEKSTSTLVSSNTGDNPVALGDSKVNSIATTTAAQGEIAQLLKSVNQIKLDTRILQDPAFLALVDTTLSLPDTVVSGRVNPFARSGTLDAAAPVVSQMNTETSVETTTSSPEASVTTTQNSVTTSTKPKTR
jgi:hypothetical protein